MPKLASPAGPPSTTSPPRLGQSRRAPSTRRLTASSECPAGTDGKVCNDIEQTVKCPENAEILFGFGLHHTSSFKSGTEEDRLKSDKNTICKYGKKSCSLPYAVDTAGHDTRDSLKPYDEQVDSSLGRAPLLSCVHLRRPIALSPIAKEVDLPYVSCDLGHGGLLLRGLRRRRRRWR